MEGKGLASEEFRDVIGRFASGVTVVTAVAGGTRYGSTASAVSSLSLEPPMLLICLNRSSRTGAAIVDAGYFGVSILGEDQPDLAERFAQRDVDKFAGVHLIEGAAGQPLIADALATLECRIADVAAGGTHTVYLAEVLGARAGTGAPLAYFRGRFGRLSLEQDDAAFGEIRARVVQRRLPTDVPLDLDALSADLDMPRAPLYHALTRLSSENLVARDADGAFVIPRVTLSSVRDALPALFAIWLGALELSAGAVGTERLHDLRIRLGALRPPQHGTVASDSAAKQLRAFILDTIGVAGSRRLQEAWMRVDVATQITRHWAGHSAPDRSQLIKLHEGFVAILDAWAAADHVEIATAVKDCQTQVTSLFEEQRTCCTDARSEAPDSGPVVASSPTTHSL
jgi:flavin reductase (DIM6/NTAB) family NADH-FMN oxidoreductase RutF